MEEKCIFTTKRLWFCWAVPRYRCEQCQYECGRVLLENFCTLRPDKHNPQLKRCREQTSIITEILFFSFNGSCCCHQNQLFVYFACTEFDFSNNLGTPGQLTFSSAHKSSISLGQKQTIKNTQLKFCICGLRSQQIRQICLKVLSQTLSSSADGSTLVIA